MFSKQHKQGKWGRKYHPKWPLHRKTCCEHIRYTHSNNISNTGLQCGIALLFSALLPQHHKRFMRYVVVIINSSSKFI